MTTQTATRICPTCTEEFAPRRKNQKFCSRPCQKNSSREGRTAEYKSRSARHYDRAANLAATLYSCPPSERLGLMKDILTRSETDAALRNILTDLKLLKEPLRADDRKNIAQAASAYTVKFFGVGIQVYIRQAREGCLNQFHPVTSLAASKPVPNLKKMRTNRCWHRPLKRSKREETPCNEGHLAQSDAAVAIAQGSFCALADRNPPPH